MQKPDITPQEIHSHKRLAVIAPAGCGKTETIVQAVSLSTERQLILTHTHAGIKSILDRLKKYKVKPALFQVETISSFALRLSQAYPKNGGYILREEEDIDYLKSLKAANEIASTNFYRKIISSSYSGIYVDEYQDCTISQHLLIESLSKILPIRIFGDPLQGIFDFVDESLVNWDKDINGNFHMGYLSRPWRWIDSNPDLGEWLFRARDQIERENMIDFSSLPAGCNWYSSEPKLQRIKCFEALDKFNSTVAIKRFPTMAHALAKGLGGKYNSMEEIECKELVKYCKHFDALSGNEFVISIITFAETCISNVKTELASIKCSFEMGRDSARIRKYLEIYDSLNQIKGNKDFEKLLVIMNQFKLIEKAHVFRKELYSEMIKCIKEKIFNPTESLFHISRRIREHASVSGRNLSRHIVSRPHLIKGLQFNHSIVMDADELNPKELYVSITRGTDRLTVFSKNRVINFSTG